LNPDPECAGKGKEGKPAHGQDDAREDY